MGHIRADTPAADPLLDPPGVCAGFQGLRVSAGSKQAKGVVTVLPRITQPACRSRWTTSASFSGTNSTRMSDPPEVRMPFV